MLYIPLYITLGTIPLTHTFQRPSCFMKSLATNPAYVYLLTVIHSRGLVIAAAMDPAKSELATLYIIYFSLNSFSPNFFL